MRITKMLTIFVILGLSTAAAYGQTSSGSGELGTSAELTMIENQATAQSSESRFVRDQVPANKFIGVDKTGYFVGDVNANDGAGARVGTSGVTRSTTTTRISSTRTNTNLGNSTRTTGTGSTSNQIPYYYNTNFETERGADPDLVRLNGPTAAVREKIQSQIDRLPKLKQLVPVTVEFDGREAILKGEVARERDRTQLEQLLIMQPGVWSVRNELTVAN